MMEQALHRLTPKLALRLAAPHTWVAAVAPALFGEVYCFLKGYSLHPILCVTLFVACILMQSAVNTFNDYFDFVKGTDTAADNVEVSDAVLVYEHINPASALRLAMAFLALAALLAVPAIVHAGWAPLLVGIVGAVCVLTYSGGIVPISYLPIGEFVSGFVMGGFIPLGIVATACSAFDFTVLIAAMPLIIGIGLIMMTNNTCDIEKDRAAHRWTLPALLGRKKARRLYRVLVVMWIVTVIGLPIFYSGAWGLTSLVLLLLMGRRPYGNRLTASLMPTHRVDEMKGIVFANVLGNGVYILTWGIILLGGGPFHG